MPNHKVIKLAALFAVIPAAIAWNSAPGDLRLGAGSRLWIAGTSTVKPFECKAPIVSAVIVDVGSDVVAAVLKGDKAVREVSFTVASRKLDCGNDKMNEHMLKALKATQYPAINFKLSSYELVKATKGMDAVLTGALTLGGVTKTVLIKAQGRELADGMLDITGTHQVRMTEYGLKPPTLMGGVIKVGDKVQVNFKLVLKESATVASGSR